MSNKQRKKRINKSRRNSRINTRSEAVADADKGQIRSDLTARSYQVRADSLDENKRSVEAVIATEAPVLVMDLCRWEVVEEILMMSGARLPDSGQVPMLDSHDRTSVQKQLGSTRNLRVEGDKLVGVNIFSNSAEAEHAWQLTREGHLNDNSIGYRADNFVTIEAGKSAQIEGRDFTASATRALRVTTEWSVKENSVCPIGADAAAKNRAAETKADEDINVNNKNLNYRKDSAMDFNQWLTERGFVEADLSERQRASLQTQFDAERAAAKKPAAATVQPAAATEAQPAQRAEPAQTVTAEPAKKIDVDAVRKEAIADERKRVEDIRALGADLDIDPEVVNRCVDDSLTVEAARAAVLEAVRAARPGGVGSPAIIVRSGEMTLQRMEDAVMLRAGFDDIVLAGANGEQRAEAADRVREISLVEICRHSIVIDGGQVPQGRENMIRAAFSTASLPTLLGAIFNKSLLRGYQSKVQTWREWCNIGNASDFKTMTRARLTDSGGFEKLGAGGEIPKGEKTEEKEQYNLETYAKMERITRVEIINDDLGVLTRIPQRMGVNGNMRIAEVAYEHMMGNPTMDDSVALFHADHSNLNTSAALTEDNLQAGMTAFQKQTDKLGKPIRVSPAVLLVPVDLWFAARKLLESVEIFIKGDTDGVAGSKNVLNGLLKPVQDEALSNSLFTNQSATTWYLFADPRFADTVEVGFLNGKQTPTVITHTNIPGVLGIGFDAFIDFNAKALDFRTVQKNTA